MATSLAKFAMATRKCGFDSVDSGRELSVIGARKALLPVNLVTKIITEQLQENVDSTQMNLRISLKTLNPITRGKFSSLAWKLEKHSAARLQGNVDLYIR